MSRGADRESRLPAVSDLKPAYLVSGDDDAKIDAWRARVRRRAQDEHGPGGIELFDARSSDPAEVAAALAALTFDPGTRYVLVDDAGAWKATALEPLEPARPVLVLGPPANARAPGVDLGVVVAADEVGGLELGHGAGV